jgi:hypothetical protein
VLPLSSYHPRPFYKDTQASKQASMNENAANATTMSSSSNHNKKPNNPNKKKVEPDRVLILGKPDWNRCDNEVVSARYTLWTFFPKVSRIGKSYNNCCLFVCRRKKEKKEKLTLACSFSFLCLWQMAKQRLFYYFFFFFSSPNMNRQFWNSFDDLRIYTFWPSV